MTLDDLMREKILCAIRPAIREEVQSVLSDVVPSITEALRDAVRVAIQEMYNPNRMISYKEACEFLDVKPKWLQIKAREGAIQRYKEGNVVRFRQGDVMDLLVGSHSS